MFLCIIFLTIVTCVVVCDLLYSCFCLNKVYCCLKQLSVSNCVKSSQMTSVENLT